MKLSSYPFWLLGFRPFFSLAILAGAVLPMLWALVYAGLIPAPATTFSSVQWHAHEMFFGFGWAVLGGFLLTASRSWVKVRGYHGQGLFLRRRRLFHLCSGTPTRCFSALAGRCWAAFC